MVTDLSQSPNKPVPRVRTDFGDVAKLVSYGNIGLVVAPSDFSVITSASAAAGRAYHYVVLGSPTDIFAQVGIGANPGVLFVLITASSLRRAGNIGQECSCRQRER